MKVRVRLFAAAKDLAGCDVLPIEVAECATIADVRTALLAAEPALANIVPHALWAVDTQYALESTPVAEQSEIALIPPVSGG
jgi:molybdopterin converting factor small subunit